MSFPPRPPPGMVPPGMPPMFMNVPPGMPPGMSIPPPGMMGAPPPVGGQPPPGGMPPYFPGMPRPGGPPPGMMRPHGGGGGGQGHSISKPPMTHNLNFDKAPDHPQPIPQIGPPVTVFVGNITEKWPDAMIRQLLATCGQVVNWKRVQGASGKLQGFGFCEYNGPDAGLRAVRLLHDLDVGDKKLVVKVDAKTNSVLEEFKADRKKKRNEEADADSNGKDENGDSLAVPGESTEENKEKKEEKADDKEDYMDDEMKEADERSRTRISIIFREFKNEIDSYVPPGNDKPQKGPKGKNHESAANKQQIQEKLHLLKLSSLENNPDGSNSDFPEDLALEEGKREIITREISNFREHMKQEKQKEEERKRLGRERREREREREKEREKRKERGTEEITSPERSMSRERENRREAMGNRDRDHDRERHIEFRDRGDRGDRNRNRRDEEMRDRRGRERVPINNFKERERERERERDREREREQRERERTRRRSRERRSSRSRSVERILRSPIPSGPSKPRYREREEEEEAAEQKRLERKAREKEAAYEERLREWETRENQKNREYKKKEDRERRQEEERIREVKKIKQFLEDYDDEKHDPKFYRNKELQKRLSERARELEADNKDRQKEREEIEDLKLRMLAGGSSLTPSSSGTPNRLLEKYKKPLLDLTNSSTPPSATQLITGVKSDPIKIPIASRLQALANSQTTKEKEKEAHHHHTNNHHSKSNNKEKESSSHHQKSEIATSPPAVSSKPVQKEPSPQPTSFSGIQLNNFVPVSKPLSNQSTPNSIISPMPIPEASPSPKPASTASAAGFQMTLNNSNVSNSNSVTKDDDNDDSRHSFSSAPSPGMVTPQDIDDSSIQGFSPADQPKKKKMDVKDVFNQDEDDDGMGLARKRKLVPLDYGDDAKKLKKEDKSQEEKKKNIKALIEKIPTDKDALFDYEVDWEKVDGHLMEKRIRPWINKKIIEYIGEPEPTLVDFICSKVMGRSAPQSILDDVQMVLDEEAEVFVVKMWRLLVYEIEARNLGVGITKGDADT